MEIAGLILALALWLAAAYASLLAMKSVIRALPAGWREHPEAAPGYAAVLASGPASVLRAVARVAPWIAAVALLVSALGALDVRPAVALATVVVGGVLWGRRVVGENRAAARAFAAAHGLEYPSDARRRAYTATIYATCLAAALTAGFAGLALWSLAG